MSSENFKYFLDDNQRFVIEDYNSSKHFSNFFPGISGLWGIPMWAFFVNRGQCIASFGIESKDKSIMEFQPANKAYRLTSLNGFRTFVKVKKESKEYYWEPFQNNLEGTNYKKTQKLSMSAHDLILEEVNLDLGLKVTVNYFTLPEEPFASLVRRVKFENISDSKCELEVVDGMPVIVPFGLSDWLNKHLSRTVEAWVKVRNVDNNAPFYQLNVEVSDTSEVKPIKEGNFFFSFCPSNKGSELLSPIVQSECVFGHYSDFTAPVNFMKKDFSVPAVQQTSNRSASAMSHVNLDLKAGTSKEIVSLIGYAGEQSQLAEIVKKVMTDGFIDDKGQRNKEIIDEIKNFALTKSSQSNFDLYASHTFLDNVLRGGLPISVKSKQGNIAFNVYSRKHGDLERDYNFFFVAPTFYSQGNGNYRDVNQNRRNDVWFNSDVSDNNLIGFMNLSQADGYNPLVVKGTSFLIEDKDQALAIVKKQVNPESVDSLNEFLNSNFTPGELLAFILSDNIKLNISEKDFLTEILEICGKQELAEHCEGFWTDHWTYNLDLIESYLLLYPEELQTLLLEKEAFYFYHNSHYVLPRSQRYILKDKGVRQYDSVFDGSKEIDTAATNNCLKKKNGQGDTYNTTLIVKILCLIANKAATFDPSGIGIEMEADKPNWYDSLNGLPGLIGSSISESFELKRLSQFLNESLKSLSLDDSVKVSVFEELSTFIEGLANILSIEYDRFSYWQKSNDIKEHYRKRIQQGIEGNEQDITIGFIKNFLNLVIEKVDNAVELAKDEKGFLSTYFYHDVVEYELLDKNNQGSKSFVKPLKFKIHPLPLFLEGYVHALRSEVDKEKSLSYYQSVKSSDLYDKKLKMYKVNTDLSGESTEIGRTRVFPASWLENESIWLHMEYKFILELIRGELFDEFYENFKNVMIPFLDPEQYGRSILENSSFIVSSAHEDKSLHGQGFVARLSGSTAEFLHIWLLMNVGKNPFVLNAKKELVLALNPALKADMFTREPSDIRYIDSTEKWNDVVLPENVYAFLLFGSTLVVYHNPNRKDTYGSKKGEISNIKLSYYDKTPQVDINSSLIEAPYSLEVRDKKVARIDVYFQ